MNYSPPWIALKKKEIQGIISIYESQELQYVSPFLFD